MRLLYLLLPLFLLAQAPVAYKELGEQVDKELPYSKTLYFEEVNAVFSFEYSHEKRFLALEKIKMSFKNPI